MRDDRQVFDRGILVLNEVDHDPFNNPARARRPHSVGRVPVNVPEDATQERIKRVEDVNRNLLQVNEAEARRYKERADNKQKNRQEHDLQPRTPARDELGPHLYTQLDRAGGELRRSAIRLSQQTQQVARLARNRPGSPEEYGLR